ncbi:MAG: hypothetical protein ACR2IE_06700 [Candidatus Sumerlaeaceae bacterium]
MDLLPLAALNFPGHRGAEAQKKTGLCASVARPVFLTISAFLWFLLAHLYMFRDVWARPTRLLAGPAGDNLMMLWNLGAVRYAMNQGSPCFWFRNAYYPEGFLFLFHTHTWLDGALGWLVQPLLPAGIDGITLWANLIQLFATIATGMLAMGALKEWGVKRWSLRLLGASVVVFCAFRSFASMGHYNFYGTEWMIAALYAMSRSRRRLQAGFAGAGILWAIIGGAGVGVALLNDQTHAVFAGLLGAIMFGSLCFYRGRMRWDTLIRATLAAAIAAALVSSIHLIPILTALQSGAFEYKVEMLDVPRMVDVTSILLPHNRHFVFGQWVSEFRATYGCIEEATYLGLTGFVFLFISIASFFATCWRWREGGYNPWARVAGCGAVGLLFLTFACGEYLQAGPARSRIVLPGSVLRHVPIVNNIRIMARWIWPAYLCFAIAGCLGFSILWRRSMGALKDSLYVVLAAFACMEGIYDPAPIPVDFRANKMMNPPGLADSVRARYVRGSVLVAGGACVDIHANILQMLWGYGIPSAMVHTARVPFQSDITPANDPRWDPRFGAWLRKHAVVMVVFPYEPGTGGAWREWIQNAERAVPGLVALNKNGHRI